MISMGELHAGCYIMANFDELGALLLARDRINEDLARPRKERVFALPVTVLRRRVRRIENRIVELSRLKLEGVVEYTTQDGAYMRFMRNI